MQYDTDPKKLHDLMNLFRREIENATGLLKQIGRSSKRLVSCSVHDLSGELKHIDRLLKEVETTIGRAYNQVDRGEELWGKTTFSATNSPSDTISSFSSFLQESLGIVDFFNTLDEVTEPQVQNSNHLDPDTLQSLLSTDLFFVNAIQLGLPVGIALDLANIPGDSYAIRNLITSQPHLSGTASQENPEAALRHLSRIWIGIALGDQGELSTWKALLESGIPPKNISIRPHLINQLGKEACPDFYCEAERLIVDAKAWKDIHSFKNLQAVVDKYTACFEESGEVRLYFPSDVYTSRLTTLNRLSSPNPSVKVTIFPMPETYKELEWRKKLFYNYIKSHKT